MIQHCDATCQSISLIWRGWIPFDYSKVPWPPGDRIQRKCANEMLIGRCTRTKPSTRYCCVVLNITVHPNAHSKVLLSFASLATTFPNHLCNTSMRKDRILPFQFMKDYEPRGGTGIARQDLEGSLRVITHPMILTGGGLAGNRRTAPSAD